MQSKLTFFLIPATLLVLVVCHLLLAIEIFRYPDPVHRLIALSTWRDLDQLVGWLAILLLALANPTPLARQAVPTLLAIGLAITFLNPLFPDDVRAGLALAGSAILTLAALALAIGQLASLARSGQAGLTLEQLWRLISVQWMLVWVAADLFLRIRFRRDGITDDRARSLLFILPAFGFLPNVLMPLSIRWWATMQTKLAAPRGQVRPRAWLVALLALNLGALFLALGALTPTYAGALSLVAVPAIFFAVVLYVLGFGSRAWSGGGRLLLGGWAFFLIALAMLLIERLSASGGQGTLWEFTAAWRMLAGIGTISLCLLGLGAQAIAAIIPERLRSHGIFVLGAAFLTAGFASTALFLVLAARPKGNVWLEGLPFSVTLTLLGVLVAGALTLRMVRGALR